MSEDDIEEAFISCLPMICAGDPPFTVRFTDYEHDAREVWQIERVIEQCGMIVRVGGISVLEVLPGMRSADDPNPRGYDGGLGAFHIWTIATGRYTEIRGVELQHDLPIFSEFWSDLMTSNRTLEVRARSQTDWPGE